MDLVDQLRIFNRVAHSGGFTIAANQMSLPRATVSLAIQQLEIRLAVRLLNRTTRRVSLTHEGEALLERSQQFVADAEELEQQFQLSSTVPCGQIRVDMPTRIARRIVAPALPSFFERYPRVSVELGSSDRFIDLVQEGADCVLRVGKFSSSALVVRLLGHLRLINCASPSYIARFGVPKSPADLSMHHAVNYLSSLGGRVAPWAWIDNGVLRTVLMNGTVAVNNVETYIACCLSGLGLIQIPAFDVQQHLQTGELIEVLDQWPAPSMPMQLVYPYRRHLSSRVQAFSGWLADVLASSISQ